MTALSVVVVSHETRDLTLRCVASAREGIRSRGEEAELVVVDNGSGDGSARAIGEGFPDVDVLALSENLGFAGGANAGLARARGDVVLLLNSDAFLDQEALDVVLPMFDQHPRLGAAGAQLLHEDGRLQNSIHAFPRLWTELVPTALLEWAWPRRFPSKRRPIGTPRDVEAVLGAAFFVRRAVVEAVGPLCEDYFFFLEETDWCWRMRRAGWRVMFVPGARIVHLSGQSSKRRRPAATRIEFHRSLYHFVRCHRGRAALRGFQAVRTAKNLGSVLGLLPLAAVSARSRGRLSERAALLAWHLRGCPSGPGLSGVAPEGGAR